MKIKFKKIKVKNFLSVGAVPIELEYISGIHAIVAKSINSETTNGQGKSTFGIDALVFELFGKSIRGLNIKEMVNNINGAECEVTVWFDLDGVNWRIERGIAPDYVRVINEDEQKDQKEDSAKKLTQQKINNLLGISYTSFINSITLNINYSKPFFKLEVSEKRQILEDIMNLVVYGRMFEKIKKEWNGYKVEKRVVESELNSLKELFSNKKETYDKLEQQKQLFENEKISIIAKLQIVLDEDKIKLDKLKSKIPDKNFSEIKIKLQKQKDSIVEKISNISSDIQSSERDILKLKNEIINITSNPICKNCKTPINSSEHTQNHLKIISQEIESITSKNKEKVEEKNSNNINLSLIKEKILKVEEVLEKIDKIKDLVNVLKNNIVNNSKRLQEETDKQFSLSTIITKEDLDKTENKLKLKESE